MIAAKEFGSDKITLERHAKIRKTQSKIVRVVFCVVGNHCSPWEGRGGRLDVWEELSNGGQNVVSDCEDASYKTCTQ